MNKEKISKQKALDLCQKFLSGSWCNVAVEQFQLTSVPGGLSNYLFCCELPDEIQISSNETRRVLLRIYGEAHQKHRSTLLIDSVVCTLLSERKLGPQVYGIFPEGRLEQFVEAESLTVSEIRDANISRKIATLLAHLHQIDMPLVKEPIWLFHTIERFLADLPTDSNAFVNVGDRRIFDEIRSVCDFSREYTQLKDLLSSVHSPVCFTHNDFQPGNILRLKSDGEQFTVIDFEYCSYNYRGFDIGNHFCEFMFDYKSSTKWPFYDVNYEYYPNEEQQMNFLCSYIDELRANSTDKNDKTERDQFARQVMKEANVYALASNFFWTLWSINMATSTTIQFGYMEYARTRLTAFYLIRHLIEAGHGQLPPRLTNEIVRSPLNPFFSSS